MRFLPLILSLVISFALTPLMQRLGSRFGWLAPVRKDRWSSRSIPVTGGIGILLAFWGALSISYFCGELDDYSTRIIVIVSILMFFLGLFDDHRKIKPPTKLAWQLVAATGIIFVADMRIDFFPWPIVNILLTYLWLVGITNALNLLDNMDGLAGGIVLIASGLLGYIFWTSGQFHLFQVAMALCGAIIGFLVFNFPPAKIFMGDSGSMFLGFLLASLAIARKSQASNIFAAMVIPTFLMLLPILDTSFVVVTRLLRGQSPFQGGKDHTSHRLVAFGLSERQTVLVLYGVAIVSGIIAATLETMDYDVSLVLVPLLLIALTILTVYLGKVRIRPSLIENIEKRDLRADSSAYQRRRFELLLDLAIIGFSYYLSFWTRYGLNMTAKSMELFMSSWPFALAGTFITFYAFRIYRTVWEYLGVNDYLRYLGAAICAGFSVWVIVNIIYPEEAYTGDVFLIFSLFLIIGLGCSRASFQVLDQIYRKKSIGQAKSGVLIYGADDDGESILTWIVRTSHQEYRVVGFIDDRPYTWGRYIQGVKVIGDAMKCMELRKQGEIQGVIISTRATMETESGSRLIEICKENGLWVKLLQIDFEDV